MQKSTGRICVAFFLSLLMAAVVSCKKAESPADDQKKEEISAERAADEGDDQTPGQARRSAEPAAASPDQGGQDPFRPGIPGSFMVPLPQIKDRLLEYQVHLTYDCRNVLTARRALIGLVPKYGFLKSSTTISRDARESCSAQVAIRADLVYDALRDFERLGALVEEQVRVEDHTGNMALQERKAKSAENRAIRRGRAAVNVAGVAKTWKDVEDALQRSEDELDQAEHEKWKIRDSVRWATVTVNLMGPEARERIVIPRYTNAFIGFVNFLLNLLYVLLWLSPVIAAGIVIYWQRSRLRFLAFWRKKKE